MAGGIYCITHREKGEKYVGATTDLHQREKCHRSQIRNGNHPNRLVRMCFMSCGDGDVIFEVLEECEPESLDEKERSWIDILRPSLNLSGAKYNLVSRSPLNRHVLNINPCQDAAAREYARRNGIASIGNAIAALITKQLKVEGYL